jgi:YD repeat-containing protein
MTIKHFALAAAWLIAFGTASADDVTYNNSGKPQKISAAAGTFTALDRNGDHRISRSEAGFDRLMSETFAEIDTDGDGFVSAAEYAVAEKTRNTVSSNLSNQ